MSFNFIKMKNCITLFLYVQLENKFLVDAQTCKRFDRIMLDEKCIKKNECPLSEKHFYNETTHACEFNQNLIENCTILISGLDDIINFKNTCNCTKCHISEMFKITNLEERRDFDVAAQIEQTLSSVTEIRYCLIISNTSAVVNLHFLNHLRRIKGENHTDCYRNGTYYSMIIEDNININELFVAKFEIFLNNGGIFVKNNPHLCSNEIKRLLKITTRSFKNKSVNTISSNECYFRKVHFRTIVKAASAIIFTEFLDLENFHTFEIIYWKKEESAKLSYKINVCDPAFEFKNNSRLTSNTFFELRNLMPSTNYGFFLKGYSHETLNFTSNYNFFTTLKTDKFIENFHSSQGLNHIFLFWNSTRDTRLFYENDYKYFLKYSQASLGNYFCIFKLFFLFKFFTSRLLQ
jgi:Receptor L domain